MGIKLTIIICYMYLYYTMSAGVRKADSVSNTCNTSHNKDITTSILGLREHYYYLYARHYA